VHTWLALSVNQRIVHEKFGEFFKNFEKKKNQKIGSKNWLLLLPLPLLLPLLLRRLLLLRRS
jgi:hypothetical protein